MNNREMLDNYESNTLGSSPTYEEKNFNDFECGSCAYFIEGEDETYCEIYLRDVSNLTPVCDYFEEAN